MYKFSSTYPSSSGLPKVSLINSSIQSLDDCTNSARAGKESDLGNIIRTIVHHLLTTHASISIRVRPLAVVPDARNRLAGDTGVETTALGSCTGKVITETALDKSVSKYITVCLHEASVGNWDRYHTR